MILPFWYRVNSGGMVVAFCCISGHLADHHFIFSAGFRDDLSRTPATGKSSVSLAGLAQPVVQGRTVFTPSRKMQTPQRCGMSRYQSLRMQGVLPLTIVIGLCLQVTVFWASEWQLSTASDLHPFGCRGSGSEAPNSWSSIVLALCISQLGQLDSKTVARSHRNSVVVAPWCSRIDVTHHGKIRFKL